MPPPRCRHAAATPPPRDRHHPVLRHCHATATPLLRHCDTAATPLPVSHAQQAPSQQAVPAPDTRRANPSLRRANPRCIGFGRLPARVPLRSYRSHADAINRRDPRIRLSGCEWEFRLFPSPTRVPAGISDDRAGIGAATPDSDCRYGWARIPVPSNWQMHSSDPPIYTNVAYPWEVSTPPCRRGAHGPSHACARASASTVAGVPPSRAMRACTRVNSAGHVPLARAAVASSRAMRGQPNGMLSHGLRAAERLARLACRGCGIGHPAIRRRRRGILRVAQRTATRLLTGVKATRTVAARRARPTPADAGAHTMRRCGMPLS